MPDHQPKTITTIRTMGGRSGTQGPLTASRLTIIAVLLFETFAITTWR